MVKVRVYPYAAKLKLHEDYHLCDISLVVYNGRDSSTTVKCVMGGQFPTWFEHLEFEDDGTQPIAVLSIGEQLDKIYLGWCFLPRDDQETWFNITNNENADCGSIKLSISYERPQRFVNPSGTHSINVRNNYSGQQMNRGYHHQNPGYNHYYRNQ